MLLVARYGEATTQSERCDAATVGDADRTPMPHGQRHDLRGARDLAAPREGERADAIGLLVHVAVAGTKPTQHGEKSIDAPDAHNAG